MSNFASLHTALTGLRASQVGLDTASHNIANANTVGFTRQRVVLTARPAYQSLVGPIGTGVQVSDIARTRDQFLDARVRAASASSANAGTTAELLGKLEDVLAEPENGITVELTELWAAFEDLGLDPSNAGARRQVISSLEALANRINTIDAGWAQLGADTEQRLAVAVDQVNDLLRDVAQLNQDIAATLAREGTPNDLLDARDVAIDELSRMLGVDEVTVVHDSGGKVRLSVGGVVLVDENSDPAAMPKLEWDPDGTPPLAFDGQAVPALGEVGALVSFLQSDLPTWRADLDDFVAQLSTTLNTQHATGLDRGTPPGPGKPLLVGGAGTLQVGISHPDEIAAGLTGAAHDGGNADALAALGSGIDDRITALVTDLGRQVSGAVRLAEGQDALAASASYARSNQHGVSLDEEMVSLVQYQRSLEAASRMMTAIDSALDTLINRTGLVGR